MNQPYTPNIVYSPNINVMIRAARKAARSLIRDFGELEQLQVSKKGPGDFVNIADKKVEQTLITELATARPDFAISSKDNKEINSKDHSFRWIIDPLNGASNFLHAIPHFGISIALEKRLSSGQTEIIASIIELPIIGKTYWCEKGEGAWVERSTDTQGGRQRLRVSGRKDLEQSCFAVSTLNCSEPIKSIIHNKNLLVRILGCPALALAYVAAGKYDVFIQTNENIYEMAAGTLLVKEAGGMVSEYSSNKNPNASGNILASNYNLHLNVTSVLNQNS